nr:hypothetical protein [Ralstonia mannitolilytica]
MCALRRCSNVGHAGRDGRGDSLGHGHGSATCGTAQFDPGQRHHHECGYQPREQQFSVHGRPCPQKIDEFHQNGPPFVVTPRDCNKKSAFSMQCSRVGTCTKKQTAPPLRAGAVAVR